MTLGLSPAEIRTGARLMRLYRDAAAHILAEEQAAEVASVPSGGDLVAARTAELVATPDVRARLAAYVDHLERTHGADPAMRQVIDGLRSLLTSHMEVA